MIVGMSVSGGMYRFIRRAGDTSKCFKTDTNNFNERSTKQFVLTMRRI